MAPKWRNRLQRPDGTIVEPMVGITGIWNFDSDDLVINGAIPRQG
jgi:hypothetical protein